MGDNLIDNKEYIDQVRDTWIVLFNYLGFVGKRRSNIHSALDQKLGKQGWTPAHFFSGKVVSPLEAYLIYEDGYYQYLKSHPKIKNWLINTASEVYDNDISNIESGLDYTIQETDSTHLQDIAIRRSLTRLELEEKGIEYDPMNLPNIQIFKGDHPIQIKSNDPEGKILSPGFVPFHKPELGLNMPRKKRVWWKTDSIEDIYQRNKVLIVDPDKLKMRIAAVSKDAVYLTEDKTVYYEFRLKNQNHLIKINGDKTRTSGNDDKIEFFSGITKSPKMKFSELKQIMKEYLSLQTKLRDKETTYENFIRRIERTRKIERLNPLKGTVYFDIKRLVENDPFSLKEFYSNVPKLSDLNRRYVRFASDLASCILEEDNKSKGCCAGDDQVSVTYHYEDGSYIHSPADFRNHRLYFEFRKKSGGRFNELEILSNILREICDRDYDSQDEFELRSDEIKSTSIYQTDNIRLAYYELYSGKTAYTFDISIQRDAQSKRIEHHIKKGER